MIGVNINPPRGLEFGPNNLFYAVSDTCNVGISSYINSVSCLGGVGLCSVLFLVAGERERNSVQPEPDTKYQRVRYR
jgi:hypothetical protein